MEQQIAEEKRLEEKQEIKKKEKEKKPLGQSTCYLAGVHVGSLRE